MWLSSRAGGSARGLFLVFLLALVAAGCHDSDVILEPQNSAPARPQLDPVTGAPRDGSVGQMTTPILSWTCTDIDGDPLSYDVFLGLDSTPPLVSRSRTTICYVPFTLDYSTTYYWRVDAHDDHGHTTGSDLWSFTTRGRPLACSASVSPARGLGPLTVNFRGGASGGEAPYAYSWTFGDDSVSTLPNPAHTYVEPGVYDAFLSVRDSAGQSCSRRVTVTVDGPLSCRAEVSPDFGVAPLTVNLTGTAGGGTAPYTFFWDFGAGVSSNEQNPTHVYTDVGLQTVYLTVTDAELATCSKAVRVTVLEPLFCTASASPASGPAPLTVNFSAQASGGEPPYRYAWAFGDGRASNEQNPTHTYTETGSFRVVLWIRDARSITCSKTITIVPY